MLGLVCFHLRDDCAALVVVVRQAPEMVVEMSLDLLLGFRQETEIPFVTEQP